MTAADLSEVPPRLRRDVGLLPLFMVSAGSVIGSGWLLGTLHASEVAGPAAIVSWVIGAILLIGIALIYAELGSTYPISGSTARFTWIHAGTLGGFFCGTFSYLQAMAVAPIEVEASLLYVNAKIWHGLETPAGLLTGKGLVVAILAMFLFTALKGPAGLLSFDRGRSPAEWRAVRLRLKQAVFAVNLRRALAGQGSRPAQILIVGGPAADEELLGVLLRSLPLGMAVGRGNVGGTLSGQPAGHRYAAAVGLALAAGSA